MRIVKLRNVLGIMFGVFVLSFSGPPHSDLQTGIAAALWFSYLLTYLL